MLKISMTILNRPIDIAILIYFRIGAGLLMAQELINAIIIGKFAEYTQPKFHFSYLYFEWIKPWPLMGMAIHFTATILAALCVAFGYRYKVAIIVLFMGQTSLFLMEMSEYINHHYLYCLISFWMIWMPLENKRKATAPAWMLYLILFHMGLAYFFGGIAKLNPDWLAGTPMNLYLAARKDYLLGFLYRQEWAPLLFSYGGICFDLFIVPLMIFSKTRKLGLVLSIMFHVSNAMMFGLATFPWFSLLLTTMFFDPAWPRKIPGLTRLLPGTTPSQNYLMHPLLKGGLAIYVIIHMLIPVRHFILYPGDPSWTEEGHMFSWRMMLREKSGSVTFKVNNLKTNQVYFVNPEHHLTPRQIHDLTGNPDLILQFGHYLRNLYYPNKVAIFANTNVGLNGKRKLRLIKADVDLALEKRTLGQYRWIEQPNEDGYFSSFKSSSAL